MFSYLSLPLQRNHLEVVLALLGAACTRSGLCVWALVKSILKGEYPQYAQGRTLLKRFVQWFPAKEDLPLLPLGPRPDFLEGDDLKEMCGSEDIVLVKFALIWTGRHTALRMRQVRLEGIDLPQHRGAAGSESNLASK